MWIFFFSEITRVYLKINIIFALIYFSVILIKNNLWMNNDMYSMTITRITQNLTLNHYKIILKINLISIDCKNKNHWSSPMNLFINLIRGQEINCCSMINFIISHNLLSFHMLCQFGENQIIISCCFNPTCHKSSFILQIIISWFQTLFWMREF